MSSGPKYFQLTLASAGLAAFISAAVLVLGVHISTLRPIGPPQFSPGQEVASESMEMRDHSDAPASLDESLAPEITEEADLDDAFFELDVTDLDDLDALLDENDLDAGGF